MSAPPEVVVIGGGVIGCAVAWTLARRDVRVTVFERARPGGGASSAAAGMLSPLKEADEPGPFLDLGVRSLERYPRFVEAVETDAAMTIDYRRDGRLDVALTDGEAGRLRDQHALQETAGYESRLLDPDALRRVEPLVTPRAVLGLLTAFDHQVDAERLGHALWKAAARRGVEVRDGVAVAGVTLDAGERTATGVLLESGERVPAGSIVVAAGAWSARLALPRPLPIRPVRGEIVILRHPALSIGRVVWGGGCYLVPRNDGRILVGASMEDAGFHAVATLGATRDLIDSALRIAPGLTDAAIHGFQVGLRPASPDGHPVLGADPAIERLFYAAGHFRNGILLAPETAELLADAILDGRAVDPAFSPARFAGGQGSLQSRV